MADRTDAQIALDRIIDPKSGKGLMKAGLVKGLIVEGDRAGLALDVAAADAAWTGGVGPWVNPDGVPDPADGPSGDPLAGRSFELWEYAAQHGSLLIRSPRTVGHDTNVDLIFDKVTYLACPSRLTEPVLVAAEPEDHARLEAAIGAVTAPQRLFVLAAQGRRHLVVATSCRVIEHVGDPSASPFDPTRFSRDWWSGLFNGRAS